MNQTLPTADLNTAGTTDVIPSVAIDRIIAQRNEGIRVVLFQHCHSRLTSCNALLECIHDRVRLCANFSSFSGGFCSQDANDGTDIFR